MRGARAGRSVTIVIPTTGRRESLGDAIASGLDQQGADVRVHVVVDASRNGPAERLVAPYTPIADITWTGGGRGAAYARDLGTRLVETRWVAYLDDDDRWLPGKLSAQLDAADVLTESGWLPVISCRSFSTDPSTGQKVGPIPRQAFDGVAPVADWLFRRRRLSLDRNVLPTPTLLLPAAAARSVGWRTDLARHHDWDFVIRLGRVRNVRFHQVEGCFVVINPGSSGSISASPDWSSSLTWATEMRRELGDPAFADFVAGQVLRYAIQARSRHGIRTCLRTLRRGPVPSGSALALGASGLISRKQFERLTHASFCRP